MSKDQPTDLVRSLRDFGEMPPEGGDSDPLIEVMNSLAHKAADEIERLRKLLIHYGDQCGIPEDEMKEVCGL